MSDAAALRADGYVRASEAFHPERLGYMLCQTLLVPEDEPLDLEPAVWFALLLLDVDDRDAVNHAVDQFARGVVAAANEHDDDPEGTTPLVADAAIRALIEVTLLAQHSIRQKEGEPDEYHFGGDE